MELPSLSVGHSSCGEITAVGTEVLLVKLGGGPKMFLVIFKIEKVNNGEQEQFLKACCLAWRLQTGSSKEEFSPVANSGSPGLWFCGVGPHHSPRHPRV